MHCVPSFSNRGEAPLFPCTGPSRNAHLFVADATDRDDRRSKALVNAAKFAAAYPRIAILAQQLNRAAQLFEIMELFFVLLCAGRARRAGSSQEGRLAFEIPANV
jgi:hypothetical protein